MQLRDRGDVAHAVMLLTLKGGRNTPSERQRWRRDVERGTETRRDDVSGRGKQRGGSKRGKRFSFSPTERAAVKVFKVRLVMMKRTN